MKTIDLSHFKAVIFDMDGTMINNMPYHKKSWDVFYQKYGISLTEEEVKQKVSGRKNNEILRNILDPNLSDEECAVYAEEKESLYRQIYATEIIEVPGLRTLIENIRGMGIRLALATTAPLKNRQFGLKALGMEDVFRVILGDEDVKQGKPNPEIYLKTAAQLDVDPQACLVFEDSPPGVQAAKAAGMTVVGVLTSHTPEELAQADTLINDFTEV